VSSLDDLMDVGEQEPAPEPTRRFDRGWGWLVRVVLVAAGGAVAINFLLSIAANRAVPYVLIGIGLVAIQVLFAVLAWVRSTGLPDTLRYGLISTNRAGQAGSRDGLATATARWGRELSWFGLQGGDGEQFARTLQPRLARLAEERLRLRHGITVRSDPARARQLLGEQLWSLVTSRATRCPSGRELAALVKQMEAI